MKEPLAKMWSERFVLILLVAWITLKAIMCAPLLYDPWPPKAPKSDYLP